MMQTVRASKTRGPAALLVLGLALFGVGARGVVGYLDPEADAGFPTFLLLFPGLIALCTVVWNGTSRSSLSHWEDNKPRPWRLLMALFGLTLLSAVSAAALFRLVWTWPVTLPVGIGLTGAGTRPYLQKWRTLRAQRRASVSGSATSAPTYDDRLKAAAGEAGLWTSDRTEQERHAK